jgi:glycosyltransferase involved in cell wall biosynthesis
MLRQHNAGIASSLNLALSKASGEYIARMDADDISEPDRLEVQLSFMLASPELSLIGSQAVLIDEHDAVLGLANMPVSPRLAAQLIKYQSPLIHPSLFATKDSICSLGGYRNLIAEDLDLFIRANRSGYLIGSCPDYLLRYRVHESSLSVRMRAENLICTNKLLSAAQSPSLQSYLDSTSEFASVNLQASAYLQSLFLIRLSILRRARATGLLLGSLCYIFAGVVSIFHIQLILLTYRAVLSRAVCLYYRHKHSLCS